MNRRGFFAAIAGLFAARALPTPAAARPSFAIGLPSFGRHGKKIGDTITMRRPARFIIPRGYRAAIADSVRAEAEMRRQALLDYSFLAGDRW